MMSSQSPMPGSGASITTHLRDARGILYRQRVAHHVADVVGDERRRFWTFSASITPAMSSAWFFLVYPVGGWPTGPCHADRAR